MLTLAAISFAARVLTGKDIAWNRGDVWVVIAYAVWGFIYVAYSWAASGRTAGMALFGVRVVRDDGTDATGRRAVVRTLAFPLSFLFSGLGFAGILVGCRAPGAARRHRRDGGHLLLGRAGGAAAVPVPGLILQHPGAADDRQQRPVHAQRDPLPREPLPDRQRLCHAAAAAGEPPGGRSGPVCPGRGFSPRGIRLVGDAGSPARV